MHITAGIWKGKKIFSPKNANIRPTTEANRQAIFNILEHKYCDIKNSTVIDLFAGSGIIGLEAISRGAKNCIFIDYQTEALKLIKKNIHECIRNQNLTEQLPTCIVIKKNLVHKWSYPNHLQKADIVILDPPYQQNIAEISIQNCINSKAVQKNTIIILEQGKNFQLKIPQNMTIVEKRDKSNSSLWFLKIICGEN